MTTITLGEFYEMKKSCPTMIADNGNTLIERARPVVGQPTKYVLMELKPAKGGYQVIKQTEHATRQII